MAVSGCASRSNDIPASYVSPIPYQALTCEQLTAEAQAISQRAAIATGAQNKRAMDDAAAMAIGLVVFWPALFLMRGDGAQAAELGRLKGEMNTIMQVNMEKGCGIQLQTAPAEA
ncbi:MAG: hypothetical protein K5872_08740 [Rhizobiaceae bacterium]|nr:hypothetical protein [Rhizobiaceae bacterium]MCV0406301.1 hypothetical protein [Rhizobiaceae bacterium]